MNKAQATALFEEHTILFGDIDAVPEQKAADLLGRAAVEFAHRMDGSSRVKLWNGYGNGEYTAYYLTLAGFLVAVTYNNVSELEKLARGGQHNGKAGKR